MSEEVEKKTVSQQELNNAATTIKHWVDNEFIIDQPKPSNENGNINQGALANSHSPNSSNNPKLLKTPINLNNALFSLNLAAIVYGIKDVDLQTPSSVWFFTLFFFLFRVKIYLNGSHYLEDETQDPRPGKQFGFLISIISWIFFNISGFQLGKDPETAYLTFIVGVSLSTVWIVIILCNREFKKDSANVAHHWLWLCANIYYIEGAIFLMISHSKVTLVYSFLILFVTLNIDWNLSETLKPFDQKSKISSSGDRHFSPFSMPSRLISFLNKKFIKSGP